MHAPLFPAPANTVAAASPRAMGFLTWTLIMGLVALVANIRSQRRAALECRHDMSSKIGPDLVVVDQVAPVASYPIPIDAVAANSSAHRPHPALPAELPYADGAPREGE